MSEYEELWRRLTHNQKVDHLAALEHLTAKYGDTFGDRSALEMRLLLRDPELGSLLTADSPLSKPEFDHEGKRLDSPPSYFLFEKAKVQSADRIALADAVQWVISRGQKIASSEAEAKFDDVVDEVLKAIAEKQIKARGLSGGELKKVARAYCGQDFEDLRKVLLLPTQKGLTSEIIIEEGDEFRGTRWVNVTLPSERVLEIWPERNPAVDRRKIENLKNRPTRYPFKDTEIWADDFFKRAQNDPSVKTRRDHEFWAALRETFPGIGTKCRNHLHKKFNPKQRAPKGS